MGNYDISIFLCSYFEENGRCISCSHHLNPEDSQDCASFHDVTEQMEGDCSAYFLSSLHMLIIDTFTRELLFRWTEYGNSVNANMFRPPNLVRISCSNSSKVFLSFVRHFQFNIATSFKSAIL